MSNSDTEDNVEKQRTDVSASEHTRFIEDGEMENSGASWIDGVEEREMEDEGSRVRVAPAQGKCVRCAQRCEKMFSCCLTSYHPLPATPTWSDRCMFAVRCPPHGKAAQTFTLVMMVVLGWAALWAVTKQEALPGGNLFALTVLLVLCVIGGRLIQYIKLPPLLGMLIVGILLRNIPGIMIGSWIDPVWASSIRLIALTVILIRAGLGLDPVQLRRLSWTVLLLAFLPCVVEASTLAVVTHFLLDFPWLWGFMLGFVLAAVSPAVVVPSMLWLQELGLGVDQGIPTLVIASGSIDDVLAITGFAVCLGITFTTGNLVFTIFRGPLELLMGIAGGTLAGIFLWYFPSKDQKGVPRVRVWMVLGTGLLFDKFVLMLQKGVPRVRVWMVLGTGLLFDKFVLMLQKGVPRVRVWMVLGTGLLFDKFVLMLQKGVPRVRVWMVLGTGLLFDKSVLMLQKGVPRVRVWMVLGTGLLFDKSVLMLQKGVPRVRVWMVLGTGLLFDKFVLMLQKGVPRVQVWMVLGTGLLFDKFALMLQKGVPRVRVWMVLGTGLLFD
ncbi:sodium/hydrogen exchanger 9B2-like isoform X2 [Branchiostoma floridae x Branchiostoma japonicum]